MLSNFGRIQVIRHYIIRKVKRFLESNLVTTVLNDFQRRPHSLLLKLLFSVFHIHPIVRAIVNFNEFALLMFLDNRQQGGRGIGPVFKKVAETLFGFLGFFPKTLEEVLEN